MDIREFAPRGFVPDDNCPDGMDCPWWPACRAEKLDDDPCPLLDRDTDRQKPVDKLMEEEY